MNPELILCIPARVLNTLKPEGFIPLDELQMEQLINPHTAWFGPRAYLEAHTDFVQVVTYSVLKFGSRVAVYERTSKGAESRLHNLLSLGFGGHIQLSDAHHTNDVLDVMATIDYAAERELREESLFIESLDIARPGVLHIHDNEVSKHHLGILEIRKMKAPIIDTSDDSLKNVRYMELREAESIQHLFESWSQAVLPVLLREGNAV